MSAEVEQAVLGALLLDSDKAADVLDVLGPDDFSVEAHRAVYGAIKDLAGKGKAVEVVAIRQRLVETNSLERAGGTDYLAELLEVVPTAANASFHAAILRSKTLKRRLLSAAETIKQTVDTDLDGDALVAACEAAVFDANQHHESQSGKIASRLVWDVMERVSEKRTGETSGVSTGLLDLDELLDGWRAPQVIIIAARPSIGKTAFALASTLHAAMAGYHVAFFSIEMDAEELIERSLGSLSGIDGWKLRKHRLQNEDMPGLLEAGTILKGLDDRLMIDDSGMRTVSAIRSQARRYQRQGKLDLLIVDYLQLVHTDGKVESQNVRVAQISREMKAIAKELRVPVLLLSQLSRAPEQRGGDQRPRLSDLRDSGAIEQDADVVMFLWNDPEDANKLDAPLTLLIEKHRNGPTGIIKVAYQKDTGRFNNYSAR